MSYQIKGEALQSESGVYREIEDGKTDYSLLRDGPMWKRWAVHMTRAIPKRGRRNWMLASTQEDLDRFKRSACRHFEQWLDNEQDEDHAAALFFNVNGVEHLRGSLRDDSSYVQDPPRFAQEPPEYGYDHLYSLRAAGL